MFTRYSTNKGSNTCRQKNISVQFGMINLMEMLILSIFTSMLAINISLRHSLYSKKNSEAIHSKVSAQFFLIKNWNRLW